MAQDRFLVAMDSYEITLFPQHQKSSWVITQAILLVRSTSQNASLVEHINNQNDRDIKESSPW
jgi:hypothetical protein